MAKQIENLVGQVFGELTVIAFNKRENNNTYWIVQCSCGKEPVSVSANHLKNGHTKSCHGKKVFKDLTGEVFGQLTVLELDRIEKNVTYWKVICSCEKQTVFIVKGGALHSGNTKSCHGRHYLEDLTNMIFGELKVISLDNDNRKDKRRTFWLCLCLLCGKEKSIDASRLKSGNSKTCGCRQESEIATNVKKYFVQNYNNIKIEHEVCINPETGKWLRCDIYIQNSDNKISGIYIELHGKQHYKVDGWHMKTAKKRGTTPEEEFDIQKQRDNIKKDYAKKHGTYIEVDLRKMNTFSLAISYIEGKLK